MFITILGSSAKQTVNRECAAIFVETKTHGILFDTGPGIITSFSNSNRKALDVDTLVLTHVHGDHILGFPYFIFTRNSEVKKARLEPQKNTHP